jgi:WD40 repeat protein
VATFATRQRVARVQFSPPGDRVIALDYENFIYVWNTDSRMVRDAIPLPASPSIRDIALASDGKMFAIGYYNNGIIRLMTERRTYDTERVQGDFLRALQFSPDHQIVASVVGKILPPYNSMLCIWDVATGKNLHTVLIQSSAELAMAFAPDGRVLATGGYAGIHLWDVMRGELITQMRPLETVGGSAARISSLGFSSNGRLLASGSDEGTLVLWTISD